MVLSSAEWPLLGFNGGVCFWDLETDVRRRQNSSVFINVASSRDKGEVSAVCMSDLLCVSHE